MGTSTLTIKFKGIEGDILDQMVSSGLFATKTEAIRSSLVNFAIRLDLFRRKRLWEKIKKAPTRKESLKQVMKDIEAVKNEA